MQKEIIEKIAAYLEKKTGFSEDYRKVTFAKRLPAKMGKDEFCKNIAAEIAAAIAPMVDEQAQDFAGWICHQVVAGRTYNKLWADYCKEKAIAPLVNHVCPDCNGSGGIEIGEHEYAACPCVNQSIAPEE